MPLVVTLSDIFGGKKMKKIFICFLLAAALCGFAAAEDEDEDFDLEFDITIGAEAWNTPGKDNYGDNTYSIGPFAELETSWDRYDLYLKAQYMFNFDDKTSQALYLEEELSIYLGPIGDGSMSVILNNYNLFGTKTDKEKDATYFYPPNENIYSTGSSVKRVTGAFEPSVLFELEPLTFTVGMPIGYAPAGSDFEGQYTDLYGKIEFAHESGLDFGATAYCNVSKKIDLGDDKSWDNLYEVDAFVSYTKEDVFSASFEVYFLKDSEGNFMKNFAFIPGIEIYVKDFTFYGKIDIRTFKDKDENWWEADKKTSVGYLVGGKMKL